MGNDSKKVLLSVIVQDQGPGIEKSDQQLLFQPFTTLEKTRSINPNGAGIGLFASKVICEKLGGDICVFSNGQNKGAIFEFRIQLYQKYV